MIPLNHCNCRLRNHWLLELIIVSIEDWPFQKFNNLALLPHFKRTTKFKLSWRVPLEEEIAKRPKQWQNYSIIVFTSNNNLETSRTTRTYFILNSIIIERVKLWGFTSKVLDFRSLYSFVCSPRDELFVAFHADLLACGPWFRIVQCFY